jgi:hypothetical protein
MPKKPYALAGFEPGCSFPEAVAVSTAPHHQGKRNEFSSKLLAKGNIFCLSAF